MSLQTQTQIEVVSRLLACRVTDSEIEALVEQANGRGRTRTLSAGIVAALVDTAIAAPGWPQIADGGSVPNSYGYRADTTAALVLHHDGRTLILVQRVRARSSAGGRGPGASIGQLCRVYHGLRADSPKLPSLAAAAIVECSGQPGAILR